jgi:dTDP-4-amino-4,6-dideoxygalactose transaminase
MTHAPDGAWYYQQIELGFNYRMTDMQAALGASQMSRLDDYIEKRHKLARRYDESLKDFGVVTPVRDTENRSALHLYPIQIDPRRWQRKEVFDHLRSCGIGVNVHYIPVHLQPDFAGVIPAQTQCQNAVDYYNAAISLPMYATLTHSQQDTVVSVLAEALR